MTKEAHKRIEDRDACWGLACLALAFCITSKEAVRYTALWTFELKSPLLMLVIIIFILSGFALILFASCRRRVCLWENNGVLFGLAGIQSAGMAVHVLRMSGMVIPEWAIFISFVAIESSLFLLAIFVQYLLRFSWRARLSAFVWGIVGSGVIQVLFVFVAVDVARWFVAASSIFAVLLLVSSRERFHFGEAESILGNWGRFSFRSGILSPKSFSGYCTIVFLVSVLLMGAYSQWRGQQDGYVVSILVQVCSGFGLMLPALAIAVMGRSLHGRSLFYICQTIVLPISLGALYLATIFNGPSISLSVLLFDAAYAVVLFVILIAPKVFVELDSFFVSCAGLLAYKIGWFVGVFATASLSQDEFSWVGNIVVTLSFLLLVVVSVVFLVGSYHSIEKEASAADKVAVTLPLEEACDTLSKSYQLTEREREVLFLLAKGRTASYIARDLVVSEPTIRTHIAHIYRKTEVNSQQQLLDLIEKLVQG